MTRSANGGDTFSRREEVTEHAFDMRSAPFAGGFFVGDYEGLASVGSFKPLFVVANDQNTANPTDAFSTRVHGPLPPPMTARASSAGKGAVGVGQHAPRRPFNGAANPYRTP